MNKTCNVPNDLLNRTWYTETSAYAFLVDAPIAFGHSQLRVSIAPGIHEEDVFSLVAKHIAICIGRFRSTFINLDLREWGPLAEYTETSGHYVKTLVLKASAKENQEEYKVHLVPCFSSHIEAANSLFRARFPHKKSSGGGLLYWIGQREHLVDYDRRPDSSTEERIKSFCLTGLAAILKCQPHPAKTA